MNETRVDFGARFLKEAERLSRKYPRVVDELGSLVEQLQQGQRPGDKISGTGYDVYKVRLRNPSASRGKSGGFRVIYYVRVVDHVILLTIYSKSQQEDVSMNDILRAISDAVSDADGE